MQIDKNSVVTLAYTLTDNDKKVIDKSDDGSFCYLHGASNIIPGLENALTGKAAGDELTVTVQPEDGYGERNDEHMQEVGRDMFPADQELEEGMQFSAEGPDGQSLMLSITKIDGDKITVDGNHPLAGVVLNFDVKIMDIRTATSEELDHGHVHGPEGHAH